MQLQQAPVSLTHQITHTHALPNQRNAPNAPTAVRGGRFFLTPLKAKKMKVKIEHSKHGWLTPDLGLCCYVRFENGEELYGVFTPGGVFIRHLTQREAYERHFGNLPKIKRFNSLTKVRASYAHKIPIPEYLQASCSALTIRQAIDPLLEEMPPADITY